MFIGLDYFIDLINDGIGVGRFGCAVLVPDGVEDCLREGQGQAAALVGQAKGDVLLKVLEEGSSISLGQCRGPISQIQIGIISLPEQYIYQFRTIRQEPRMCTIGIILQVR